MTIEHKSCLPPGVTVMQLDGSGGARPVEPADAMTTPDCWININFSEPAACEWAWSVIGLDETVLAAMLDVESRPRSVQHGRGVLVMLRGVNLNPGARLEDMISVRAWLEPGRIVTSSRRRLRSLTEICSEIEHGEGPPSPAELLLTLIDKLNLYIGEGIEQIEENIDRAEEEIGQSADPGKASAFNRLRRQTAQIRRYLSPQRDALEKLSRTSDSLFAGGQTIELREQLNLLTLRLEDLDLVRERAMVAQEEFLALLAHEQNTRMLLLSIVAALFLPLSFLTGLFGMNVAGLPGLEWAGSFAVISGMMLAIALVILVLFRGRKWL